MENEQQEEEENQSIKNNSTIKMPFPPLPKEKQQRYGCWMKFSIDAHGKEKPIINVKIPLHQKRIRKMKNEDPIILVAEETSRWMFPNGIANFEQRPRISLPSRSYLKLFEILYLLSEYPKEDSLCVDFGASPGGCTLILANMLKCRVVAIDTAKEFRIPKHILLNPTKVQVEKMNAFNFHAKEFVGRHGGPVDWIFWDVIADPVKVTKFLLTNVLIHQGLVKNIIVIFKLHGEELTDDIRAIFLALLDAVPNSRFIRLFNNKNEVCWVYHDHDVIDKL